MEIMIHPETLRNLSEQKMLGQHTTRILFYMLGVMDADNVAKISQRKLAERLTTSGQTVYASTKWLVEAGLVAKLADGKRQKSFIVSPALAIRVGSTPDDYERIMDVFTEAQGQTVAFDGTIEVEETDEQEVVPEGHAVATEDTEAVDIPFIGITEG